MDTLEMTRILAHGMERMCTTWEKAGFSAEEEARFKAKFGAMLQAMVSEHAQAQEDMVEDMERRVMMGLDKAGELSLILGSGNGQVQLPESVMSLPLARKLEVIEGNVDMLREAISKREHSLKQMHAEIHALWEELGVADDEDYEVDAAAFASVDGDLSDERLARFRAELLRLQEIKKERVTLVGELSDAIQDLWCELDVAPNGSFDRAIERGAVELTSDSLSSLQLRRARLELEREDREAEVQELVPEITRLWGILNVGEGVQQQFFDEHKGLGRDTILACKMELNRLQVLFQDSLRDLTEEARAQIRELRGKLHVSEAEAAEFTAMHGTEYTERLLNEHRAEIERLEALLEDSAPVLAAIGERVEMMASIRKFEKEAAMPERLTSKKSRPGQLLHEEKFRRQSMKKLARIEAGLVGHLKAFSAKYDRPFMYEGVDYYQVVKHDIHERKAKPDPVRRRRNLMAGGSAAAASSSAAAKRRAPSENTAAANGAVKRRKATATTAAPKRSATAAGRAGSGKRR